MLQAPRIVRWTLPALLLTLVVGCYAIVTGSGVLGGTAQDQSAPAPATTVKHHAVKHAIVRGGDTPDSIARRSKLTVAQLLDLNPGVDPRALRPGQRLKISR